MAKRKGARLELFGHEEALMSGGKTIQRAENAVAMSLVKVRRLEAKGVQVGVLGATLLRLFFGGCQ
jgi:hypothetical protein